MRVISGKFKYKLLYNPKDDRVRPTTDRIKETLFNIVASKDKVDGVFVLDLFAGSGALGIESISRGASKVVFIDKDRDSFALVQQNLST
jgi:16S rRNA (guanine966-N2)-methyltransferase